MNPDTPKSAALPDASPHSGGEIQINPLTSIRFFAAIAVVIFHSGAAFIVEQPQTPLPLANLLLNGYVGVTFFFVLSGFILQLVYGGKTLRGDILGKYFAARFARVYPVYLLAILMMVPFIEAFGASDVPQFVLLQSWVMPGFTEFANWNAPAWTLSVELLFYLLFPLISVVAHRQPMMVLHVTIWILLVGIVATGSPAAFPVEITPWLGVVPLPLMRLPEFIVGVALGEIFLRTRDRPAPVAPALLIGVMLIVLSLSRDPRMAGLATVFSVMIILAVARSRAGPTSRLLSWPPLVILGGASYALYLLHFPIHVAVDHFGGGSKIFLLLQYPAAICASIVVFVWYEEPARKWLRSRIAPVRRRDG